MQYKIRKMDASEYPLLNAFLYAAIFVPKGAAAPPKSIIETPELQVYIADFGTGRDDLCFVAEADGQVVGAVWCRIMPDYGHIDDQTPSLAISVLEGYRGKGVGTALLRHMLHALAKRGCARVSLSVQKANAACRLYQRAGFSIYDENEEEYIMVTDLKGAYRKTE